MPPAVNGFENIRGDYDIDYNEYNYCCNRKMWCVIDCPGLLCSALTWLLIIYAEFVVVVVILIPHPNFVYQISNAIAYNLLTLLAVSSYLRAMLSDPGAVPIDNAGDYTRSNRSAPPVRCRKCGCLKPQRAHHCSVCRRCIRKMDHHCPWINNCVGEDNRKYFVLFNLYIALMCYYTGILTLMKFLACMENDWKDTTPYNSAATLMLLSTVALEAFVFGIFTTTIGSIQLYELLHDRTYIDKIKHEDDDSDEKSSCENCQSVFGEDCCTWFSPCSRAQRSRITFV